MNLSNMELPEYIDMGWKAIFEASIMKVCQDELDERSRIGWANVLIEALRAYDERPGKDNGGKSAGRRSKA